LNNKFILIFVVILNIMSISFSAMAGQDTGLYTEAIDILFDINPDVNTGQVNVTGFSNNVTEASNDFTRENKGLISSTVGGFYDVYKIIIAAIGILTPFPIIGILNSLGVIWYVSLLITAPLILMYFIGIVEMVRGGSF